MAQNVLTLVAGIVTEAANAAPALTSTATDIKMNGAQSAGSLATAPKSDHVHPSDTTRQAVTATWATLVASATPTTVITLSGDGLHTIYMHLAGDPNTNYSGHAVIGLTSGAAKILTNTGNVNWTISLSGLAVQITQNTGTLQWVQAHYQCMD